MKHQLVLLFYCLMLAACATPAKTTKLAPIIESKTKATHYNQLTSHADFMQLQGEPLTLKYGGVTSVKVVMTLPTQKLYFINSNFFKYHFEFCIAELNAFNDLFFFNQYNYSSSKKRQFILGNINYYSSKNLYTLEFASSEVISQDNIDLYNTVAKQLIFNQNFYFFVATNKQKNDFDALHKPLPTLTENEVYEGLTYQPIVKKEAYGILRKVDVNDLQKTKLGYQDILLTNGSPMEVAGVAGIITTAFQAPLSHLCILSQNRKTPLAAYKTAWNNIEINKWIDKPIHLQVANDSLYITASSLAEIALKNKKNTTPIKLKPDYSKHELLPIQKINYQSVAYAGGKASNMGELHRINTKLKINLPQGAFCIPIYFYKQHLQYNHLDTMIANKLQEIDKNQEANIQNKNLKAIRKAIKQAPINPELLAAIKSFIVKNNLGERYRFRSSTNAEDIDGFNGAGLYDSKTGTLTDTSKNHRKSCESCVGKPLER